MRNEQARKLLEQTPQSTKDWLRKYSDLLIDKSLIGRFKLWWFLKTTRP